MEPGTLGRHEGSPDTRASVSYFAHFSHVLVARQNHTRVCLFFTFSQFFSNLHQRTTQITSPGPQLPAHSFHIFIHLFNIFNISHLFPALVKFVSHFEAHPMAGLCPFRFVHILFTFISCLFHILFTCQIFHMLSHIFHTFGDTPKTTW